MGFVPFWLYYARQPRKCQSDFSTMCRAYEGAGGGIPPRLIIRGENRGDCGKCSKPPGSRRRVLLYRALPVRALCVHKRAVLAEHLVAEPNAEGKGNREEEDEEDFAEGGVHRVLFLSD